jgi:tetratricopeptide (TPR) repeat protein
VLRFYANKPLSTDVAIATRRLGSIALQQGKYKLAESLYSEALEISRQLKFQTGVADNLHNLAIVKQEQGDLNEARRLYQESFDLSGSLNDDSKKGAHSGRVPRAVPESFAAPPRHELSSVPLFENSKTP